MAMAGVDAQSTTTKLSVALRIVLAYWVSKVQSMASNTSTSSSERTDFIWAFLGKLATRFIRVSAGQPAARKIGQTGIAVKSKRARRRGVKGESRGVIPYAIERTIQIAKLALNV